MKIDQRTSLYGVLGYPVRHSLSPAIHNAAFAAKGINAVYLAFETMDVEGAMQAMRPLGIKGMSVTIPYKSAVIPFLDKLDRLAEDIGAVNTVVNQDGCLVGYNTDATGALKALEQKIDLMGKDCLIVGAGGAARAIGYILKEHGVRLTITNRTSFKGESLAERLDCSFIPWEERGGCKPDIVIQTTPIGMTPNIDECPLPGSAIRRGMTVMDVVYNPAHTRLLKIARAKGCNIVSGVSMFVHQGVEQFRLWTGIEPPVRFMEQTVKKALAKAGMGK